MGRMFTGRFTASAALICASGVLANECDSVLIPTITDFTENTQESLDLLSILKTNSENRNKSSQNLSATIPIYGVPVQFGYSNEQEAERSDSVLRYFRQNLDRSDSISYSVSDVSSDKARLWAECMNRDLPFVAYFDPDMTRGDSASLWVRISYPAPQRQSKIFVAIKGGTWKGKKEFIYNTFQNNGYEHFDIKRDPDEKISAEVSVDGGKPQAIVIRATQKPKFPKVSLHVYGKLQNATIDKIYPDGQFNIEVLPSNRVVFNSNQANFNIDQMVDGKVCWTKSVSSSALGTANDTPEWRIDKMTVGCQADSSPIATMFQCFVDPVLLGACFK